jgi:predicted alpha-1,2-mannosidase
MKKNFYSVVSVFVLSLCSNNILLAQVEKTAEPADYVNPYMGNISHLLVPTYPTVHLPNSILRVYPQRDDYTGHLLNGLPLVITSHRGTPAFSISPFQGDETGIRPVIQYSWDNEKITPYSYSVYLDEQKTAVSFAPSHQSAIYEFMAGNEGPLYIVITSFNGKLVWDGSSVRGYQIIENETYVYLALKPGTKPGKVFALSGSVLSEGTEAAGKQVSIVLKYDTPDEVLAVRYGISFIDTDQASANLDREIKNESAGTLAAKGKTIWNRELGKIAVEGGSTDDQKVFYTSLYRTLERPVCISEDGRYYSAYDRKVHSDNGRPFYTDDWIWDSYRAHHPLRILLDPAREEDILNSFVLMTDQMERPWWPTFPDITGDGRKMNSNHGVATVLDAWRKGLRRFDLEKSYLACKAAITEKTLMPWSDKPAGKLDQFYKENGYIPALLTGEKETNPEVHSFEKRQPVAVTLGTAYDEWCLAGIAAELGKKEDEEYFMKRSFNYRNLFNPATGFFHPKDASGKFIEPFNYSFSGGMGARDYYDENNGWIYRWDVQHNIPDLIDLMGGKKKFTENLDAMFAAPLGRSKYAFYAQLPDHTGNVGQFSMANEPSLHIPYLYNYAGQPWKTQKSVRLLLKSWFRNDLMGVPGDEDGGGLSAFVVFSQMGFYPVTPGEAVYTLGSPVFGKVTIKMGNGKILAIEARNVSDDNKYIQSVSFNGRAIEKPFISHIEIAGGGRLVFEMGPVANRSWGN